MIIKSLRKVIAGLGLLIVLSLVGISIVSYWQADRFTTKSDFSSEFEYADQFEQVMIDSDYPLYSYYQDNNAKTTMIFLHDILFDLSVDGKVTDYVDTFGDDYNYLTFDMRGHGKSGGDLLTFGRLERYDVSKVVHYALSRHSNNNIVLVGFGIGGTIAIQSAGVENQVDALILENPISSIKEYSRENLAHKTNLPAFPFIYTIPFYMGVIGGYDPLDVDVTVGIKTKIPMLILANETNKNISANNSYRIFSVVEEKNEKTTLITDPGEYFILENPDKYFDSIKEFLKSINL